MAKLYNQKTVGSQGVVDSNDSNIAFTYKGFNSQETKNKFKMYDIDLVKQDIINHFYIRKGEKLMNPDFGTIIWDILFEPFTEEVKKLITEDVEQIINYDPRIAINSVSIDSTDMGIRIEAEITYLPFNINERMVFNFDKENNIIN